MKKASNVLKDFNKRAKAIVNEEFYDVLLKERFAYTKNGQKITYPAICTTLEYSMFKYFLTNRKVIMGHVKKMGYSITTISSVNRQVIVVKLNGEYYVADGQHLLSWLISQNMPVEFLLCEVTEKSQAIDIMRVMNSSAKRWGLPQFVNVNTAENVRESKKNPYNKLLGVVETYKNKTGITIKVMSALMYNEAVYNEGAASRAIQEGYFVQNVPDVRLNKRLSSLKRFYRATKMSATNYLNAAFFELLYSKEQTFYQNEKNFFQQVARYVKKHEMTNIKFGNRVDALNLLQKCWINM
jgi:hypothetical protein